MSHQNGHTKAGSWQLQHCLTRLVCLCLLCNSLRGLGWWCSFKLQQGADVTLSPAVRKRNPPSLSGHRLHAACLCTSNSFSTELGSIERGCPQFNWRGSRLRQRATMRGALAWCGQWQQPVVTTQRARGVWARPCSSWPWPHHVDARPSRRSHCLHQQRRVQLHCAASTTSTARLAATAGAGALSAANVLARLRSAMCTDSMEVQDKEVRDVPGGGYWVLQACA